MSRIDFTVGVILFVANLAAAFWRPYTKINYVNALTAALTAVVIGWHLGVKLCG